MSYSRLIDGKVRQAFNLLKDLARPVTLVKKEDIKFDFQKAEVTAASSVAIVTKAIMLPSDRKSSKTNVVEKQIMLKSQDTGLLNQYTELTDHEGKVWTFGDVIRDSGFILMVYIYREKA